jgi:hypothetical protein
MIEMGSRGQEVRDLQLKLKALGYDPGDIDGIFGKHTQAALKTFQEHYEALEVTGILDPATAAALAQALVVKPDEGTATPTDPASTSSSEAAAPAPCKPEIWSAFLELVDTITRTPVRYGPGRGLFRDGTWIVTHGPGALGSNRWTSLIGTTYPSFHCSSWTNFFLGWLLRYNDRFTHCGNIPNLFELCEQPDEIHQISGGGTYRGYGPHCREIVSNGDSFQRTKIRKVLDLRELHARRETLPTFIVCGQSTRFDSGWRWWHHTVLFAIDHASPGHPMYRLAADGVLDAQARWSGKAMERIEITEQSLSDFDRAIYRGYGIVSADGSYGGDRPLAPVTIET